MAEHNEWRLLRRYAGDGSQAAFRALVDRYANLVYSTCLRELGDRQIAEDATQATFLVLAQKARHLRSSAPLSAWLFSTARLVSKNARRREAAQRRTEKAAMDDFARQAMEPGQREDEWSSISDNLHAAIDKLNASDRETIMLRFFEQRSMRETGDLLGISEDAAKKRVSRALEKLRGRLSTRHAVVPVAVLSALLIDRAVTAAPETCLTSLQSIAYPLGLPSAGHIASGNAGHYAQGALHSMKVGTQLKVAAGVVAAVTIMSAGAGMFAFGLTMRAGRFYVNVPTPAQGWLLRRHFTPGGSITYKVDENSKITPQMSMVMELTFTNNVVSVDPATGDGTVRMQLAVDKVLLNGQPTAVPPNVQTELTKPADLTITPLGVANPAAGEGSDGVLQGIASSAGFPDKAVKPGDTWTSDFKMIGADYAVQSTLDHVEQQNGRRVAVINETVTKTADLPGAVAEQLRQQMGFDTSQVQQQYDVDTGTLLIQTSKSISTNTVQTPQGTAQAVSTTDQTITAEGM